MKNLDTSTIVELVLSWQKVGLTKQQMIESLDDMNGGAFIIYNYSIYRDGGTKSYWTNIEEICEDHGIGTHTKGKLFYGHPNKKNPIQDESLIKEIKEAILIYKP